MYFSSYFALRKREIAIDVLRARANCAVLFHIVCEHQLRRLGDPNFFPFLSDNWGKKAIGRKTTGTGRTRHLKDLPRRFKNGFREGERSSVTRSAAFRGSVDAAGRCRAGAAAGSETKRLQPVSETVQAASGMGVAWGFRGVAAAGGP